MGKFSPLIFCYFIVRTCPNTSCTRNRARIRHLFRFGIPRKLWYKPAFEEFYENEFQQAKSCCGYTEEAKKTVAALKAHGTRVALATNPLYPAVATESRIRWAGLEPEDFEFYTTYENSCFCKPNPLYYTELAEKLGVKPEECLMVGNDADEDIAAEKAGMKVFLLTDCLLNKQGKDIGKYPNGSFEDLNRFLSDCGLI